MGFSFFSLDILSEALLPMLRKALALWSESTWVLVLIWEPELALALLNSLSIILLPMFILPGGGGSLQYALI